MRRQIQRLIEEGASDDEVKEFLASRYGEAVLYSPRLSPATALLWAAPFVLLVLGGFVFWRVLAARANQPLDEEPPP
jgi:cytochrome c-type biogenesis protein CcmH